MGWPFSCAPWFGQGLRGTPESKRCIGPRLLTAHRLWGYLRAGLALLSEPPNGEAARKNATAERRGLPGESGSGRGVLGIYKSPKFFLAGNGAG
jgi:hypothetical protein